MKKAIVPALLLATSSLATACFVEDPAGQAVEGTGGTGNTAPLGQAGADVATGGTPTSTGGAPASTGGTLAGGSGPEGTEVFAGSSVIFTDTPPVAPDATTGVDYVVGTVTSTPRSYHADAGAELLFSGCGGGAYASFTFSTCAVDAQVDCLSVSVSTSAVWGYLYDAQGNEHLLTGTLRTVIGPTTGATAGQSTATGTFTLNPLPTEPDDWTYATEGSFSVPVTINVTLC